MMSYSRLILIWGAAAILSSGCVSSPKTRTAANNTNNPGSHSTAPALANADAATAALAKEVIAAERGFAQSMAKRDFNAFVSFLSPEAVFFSGNTIRHGAAEIAAQWRQYFEGSTAPFSWSPDHVEVLPSGQLALSTGPVYEQGKIVGRFNAIWRLDAPHSWHIVFDKGEAVCTGLL